MFDKDRVLELAQAEDYAYYKGDLVLSLPKGSYTTEEMWEILMEMFKASIAIQDEMRRHFESLPGLDQIRLFDALCESGVRTPEWWFSVLLADQEPLPDGFLVRHSLQRTLSIEQPPHAVPASLQSRSRAALGRPHALSRRGRQRPVRRDLPRDGRGLHVDPSRDLAAGKAVAQPVIDHAPVLEREVLSLVLWHVRLLSARGSETISPQGARGRARRGGPSPSSIAASVCIS